ncbi:MAG: IS30 family transposase, partial [Spirochaetes bacterium]
EKDWSPEQISKRLKLEDKLDISFVRIYQLIEQDKQKGGNLYTHLRFHHTGHRRAKYGAKYQGGIKDRVSISKRPEIVNDKTRVGDWEIDTIMRPLHSNTSKISPIKPMVKPFTIIF